MTTIERSSASPGRRPQVAALPYRRGRAGGLEVMLVTSRETRRWVIPKGWSAARLKPHAAAEREAFEEAGVVGRIGKTAVGRYDYQKRLKGDGIVTCRVEVFLLAVRQQRKRWPEQGEREGRWFSPEDAAAAVDEPDLAALIRGLDAMVARPDRSAA